MVIFYDFPTVRPFVSSFLISLPTIVKTVRKAELKNAPSPREPQNNSSKTKFGKFVILKMKFKIYKKNIIELSNF